MSRDQNGVMEQNMGTSGKLLRKREEQVQRPRGRSLLDLLKEEQRVIVTEEE